MATDESKRSGKAAGTNHAAAGESDAAQTIVTDGEGLVEGPIEIPAADGTIPGYRARPDSDTPAPVVLLVHEIFGLHAYIQDMCRRLAKCGYLAIAPDLYQRQGDVSGIDDIWTIIDKVVMKVPDDQVLADLDAATAWAKDSGEGDIDRLAIIGFCWGGRFVWLYSAHNPAVRAGASWYGRLAAVGPGVMSDIGKGRTYPLDIADRLHAPVIGLYGAEDMSIPLEMVDQMREKLADTANESEIIVYPGANHGFHADYRAPLYHREAAEDGWQRMLEWFEKYVRIAPGSR
jgi:carboxymethylenebutenolidase